MLMLRMYLLPLTTLVMIRANSTACWCSWGLSYVLLATGLETGSGLKIHYQLTMMQYIGMLVYFELRGENRGDRGGLFGPSPRSRADMRRYTEDGTLQREFNSLELSNIPSSSPISSARYRLQLWHLLHPQRMTRLTSFF